MILIAIHKSSGSGIKEVLGATKTLAFFKIFNLKVSQLFQKCVIVSFIIYILMMDVILTFLF